MLNVTETTPENHDQREAGTEFEEQATPSNNGKKTRRRRRKRRKSGKETPPPHVSNDPHIRLAIYVAMAPAGLALSLAILYGLTNLLQGYNRPIQWAILCSIPLRELQKTLFSFWSHSLNLGFFEATIAIPIAILRATTASLIDSHAAVLRLLRHPAAGRHKKIGFAKLMQWLVSIGLFVLVYERPGLLSVPVFTIPCIVAYMMGFGAILNPDVASTLARIKSVRYDGRKFRDDSSSGHGMSRYVTCFILSKLKGLIGIGLIMSMFVGSGLGLLFFSYKIAIEGKEAVFSLTFYLEENNYAERIGIKKRMDEKQVPELIDAHTTKFYVTVSQTIDSLAIYYNVTGNCGCFQAIFHRVQVSEFSHL